MKTASLNKKNLIILIASIVSFVLGLLFCILSQSMIETMRTIICILLIIYGGFFVVSYCVLSAESRSSATFITAIISIVLSLLIMFIPSFLTIAICLLVIARWFFEIITMWKQKKVGETVIWWQFGVDCAFVVAGLVLGVICNFNIPAFAITLYLGLLLVFEGIYEALLIFVFNKNKVEEKTQKVENLEVESLQESAENQEINE